MKDEAKVCLSHTTVQSVLGSEVVSEMYCSPRDHVILTTTTTTTTTMTMKMKVKVEMMMRKVLSLQ